MTRKKRPSDSDLIAKQIVEEATQDKPTEEYPPKKLIKEKNPAAVALGRLGGLKGGKARADKLSAQVRHEIAVKAAKKRWGKKSGD